MDRFVKAGGWVWYVEREQGGNGELWSPAAVVIPEADEES